MLDLRPMLAALPPWLHAAATVLAVWTLAAALTAGFAVGWLRVRAVAQAGQELEARRADWRAAARPAAGRAGTLLH